MGSERISPARRLVLQNAAEVEIQRYRDDHYLWHKHVHNVELDPVQVLKCLEMDQHRNTIDFSCRRTGKTSVKELFHLKDNATNADQALGIVAPREKQSQANLDYHLEAIRRSPILSAYIAQKGGRQQIADTYYQFANRSRAEAYGIMANVDGGDLTAASLEEVDDMPKDRLFSRFLLMLGANRRLGASKESKNEPQIRITGVFKGADTLTELVAGGHYHLLPTVNVHLGIEMGILNEQFMLEMREQLSHDEYIRQLLCRNTSSRNLIWERWIRRAIQVGVKARLELAEPIPGESYKKRGLVGFGYDASGHGEDPDASRHAFVVTEQIGNFMTFPFAYTWPAGTSDDIVKNDLKAFWRYFNPDAAIGDAYGVGMLTQVNDELFADGLTSIDRRAVGDGQSTASSWIYWPFAPLRFEGMTKHQMATAVRALFVHSRAAMPYIDDRYGRTDEQSVRDMHLLQHQLANIKAKPTTKAYPSYQMVQKKLGDDLFDAAMAAVWSLMNRMMGDAPTEILLGKRSPQSLMEARHG
jgi:hypothetical protein